MRGGAKARSFVYAAFFEGVLRALFIPLAALFDAAFRDHVRESSRHAPSRPQHPRPQSSPRRCVARKRTFKLLADSRAKCVSRSFTTTAEQSADAEHSGFFVLGFR